MYSYILSALEISIFLYILDQLNDSIYILKLTCGRISFVSFFFSLKFLKWFCFFLTGGASKYFVVVGDHI